MARDARVFSDACELLEDYEEELRHTLIGGGEDEDIAARYYRVWDIRRRFEAEFEDSPEGEA